MRALIVDEDSARRVRLHEELCARNIDAHAAESAPEALETIWNDGIRIVVIASEMASMSGTDFVSFVRSSRFPVHVFAILLAHEETAGAVVSGLRAGADAVVSRPGCIDEVEAQILAATRLLSTDRGGLAVYALAKLAEARDPETGRHLERIASYCRALTEQLAVSDVPELDIDDRYLETICRTSPLHDIGKVGIPDSVLLKPGALTDAEFEIMKTHTTIGGSTLGAALQVYPEASYLATARDIALTHHERFDGGGYPLGLAEREVPLCGRIVALADVYDALTSNRVYKGAVAHEAARSTIIEERGAMFDPLVVDAFLRVESNFIHINDSLTDRAGDPVAP